MLLNKVKTPCDHRAAIRGVMGGENFFKNRQNHTKLRKGRVTANEDVSRPFWLLEPPQIPVSGSHNPEVAGSSPVSATTKSPEISTISGLLLYLFVSRKCILGVNLVLVLRAKAKGSVPEIH